jgi:hypothetical protein
MFSDRKIFSKIVEGDENGLQSYIKRYIEK